MLFNNRGQLMTSRAAARSKREFLKTLGVGTAALAGAVAGSAVVAGAGAYFVREPEVSSLRGQVNTLGQANTDLEAQRAGLSSQVSSLQSNVNSLTTEKSTLQTQVNSLTTEKSTLETVVNSLTTGNADLTQKVDGLADQLTGLQTQLDTANNQLLALQEESRTLTRRLTQLNKVTGETGERLFIAVAFSKANVVDGVDHRIAMNITGRFNADKREVEGGGNFVHFDNAPLGPKPIIAYGRWEATKFVNFKAKAAPSTYALIESGVLDAEINLLDPFGGRAVPATLHYVCNIGPAGLSTGEDEGYTLTIPGSLFTADGAGGPFKPLVPPVGITHISGAF